MDLFINGLKICEQINFNDYIPRFYNNIGNIYVSFKDYIGANKHYKKACDLCKNDDGNELQASILMNMIGVSYYLNDYEQARKYINEYDKFNFSENLVFKHSNLISLGMLNMNIKRYDSALYYFKKSFEIKDICDFGVKYRCISCSNIANAYEKMFCYDSAICYLNINLNIADKYKLFDILSESYGLLSELYNKSGNKNMSQFYRGKYFDINDSLFSVKEYGKIKQIQYLYEMEKIDKQIQLLNAEKQNKDDKIKMQQSILGV